MTLLTPELDSLSLGIWKRWCDRGAKGGVFSVETDRNGCTTMPTKNTTHEYLHRKETKQHAFWGFSSTRPHINQPIVALGNYAPLCNNSRDPCGGQQPVAALKGLQWGAIYCRLQSTWGVCMAAFTDTDSLRSAVSHNMGGSHSKNNPQWPSRTWNGWISFINKNTWHHGVPLQRHREGLCSEPLASSVVCAGADG